MTTARLRRVVLNEVYQEPYVYRRADLYAVIPAARDDIDAAIAALVNGGDLYVDANGDLSLTPKQSRERGRRMDEKRKKKGAQ